MVIQLQSGIRIRNPQKITISYYGNPHIKGMGKGVHKYDGTKLPEDNSFSEDQMRLAIHLVNGFGGRGIPTEKVIKLFSANQAEIEARLAEVPFNRSIFDAYDDIPWSKVKLLFDSCRVSYIGRARMTKILHKKRPDLIPILDSVVVDKYLEPLLAKQRIASAPSEIEKAVYYIKILKGDVDRNRHPLMELQSWAGKHYHDISILRVLDILIWSCFGPFRERICGHNLLIG